MLSLTVARKRLMSQLNASTNMLVDSTVNCDSCTTSELHRIWVKAYILVFNGFSFIVNYSLLTMYIVTSRQKYIIIIII